MASSEGKIAIVVSGGNGLGEACYKLMVARSWKLNVTDHDAVDRNPLFGPAIPW
jgi:NAD(P)-dependent dehydrogenase (short-subunit alcohol dehydrogenase family)